MRFLPISRYLWVAYWQVFPVHLLQALPLSLECLARYCCRSWGLAHEAFQLTPLVRWSVRGANVHKLEDESTRWKTTGCSWKSPPQDVMDYCTWTATCSCFHQNILDRLVWVEPCHVCGNEHHFCGTGIIIVLGVWCQQLVHDLYLFCY